MMGQLGDQRLGLDARQSLLGLWDALKVRGVHLPHPQQALP